MNPQCLSSDKVLVVHSSSSANNPITYSKFFKAVTKYQNNFPYEKRAGPATLTIHRNPLKYARTFRYRSQIPTEALYYLTRVLATKQFAADVKELREGVESVRQANITFQHYTMHEWIFDNANCAQLEAFVKNTSPEIAD